MVIMKIKGIDSIEQADTKRLTVLYMDRNDVTLDDDVFFQQDILNCTVVDADSGRQYGKITDIIETGANDVYHITDNDGKNYLIPVIEDVVISTDIDSEVVTIRPLKGIFDDED